MTKYLDSFTLPALEMSYAYPHNILAPKRLRRIDFDSITIFYGSNGSGKSTLLNIIARVLELDMQDQGNDAEFLQSVIEGCRYQKSALFGINDELPRDSRFIRSEDVMHGIVKFRQRNDAIKQHIRKTRPDLYEQYFCLGPDQKKEHLWDADKWIISAIQDFGEAMSNGELAYGYFRDHIDLNSLVLLDEPENSLAPKLQQMLAEMVLNYARFFECQFIIATHSPFLLSIPGAKIYNLDATPSQVCRWNELENIKAYIELFKQFL